MAAQWEKGVIVGRTGDERTYFVASSYDTLVMYTSNHGEYQLGDCVEFIGRIYTGHRDKVLCERVVLQSRRCQNFVDFEMEKRRNSCLLVCDIIDLEEKCDDNGKVTRVIRTDFLQVVLDSSVKQITSHYSKNELLKMRAVCKRIVDTSTNTEFWAILNIVPKNASNKLKETSPMSEAAQSYSGRDSGVRKQSLKGFVCTIGTKREELYVWVPGNERDLLILPHMLKGRFTPRQLFGRWVSFEVNRLGKIHENSNIQLIDDQLPTRCHGRTPQIRVRCSFDPDKFDHSCYAILESDMCGKIADDSRVLKKYNRFCKFEDYAWVYSYMFDETKNIRFVLASTQDKWEEVSVTEREISNNRSTDDTSRYPGPSEPSFNEKNYSSYSEGYYSRSDDRGDRFDGRDHEDRRDDDSYGHVTDINGYYPISNDRVSSRRVDDEYRREREELENYRRSVNDKYIQYEEDNRRNNFENNRHEEIKERFIPKHFYDGEDHFSTAEKRELSRGADDLRRENMRIEDLDSSKPRDSSQRGLRPTIESSSRIPNGEPESICKKDSSRRMIDFEKSPSPDLQKQRNERESASSSEFRRKSHLEKKSVTTRGAEDDMPKSSSSSSIPKKSEDSELDILLKKLAYYVELKFPIPAELTKRVEQLLREEYKQMTQNEIASVRVSESYSSYCSDETTSGSSSISRKEKSASGDLAKELARYKRIVHLLRKMLSDDRVCRAMRKYDSSVTDEIHTALFHT